MGAALYCSIDDVLLLVAAEGQARLTTEPGRPVLLGVADSTSTETWDTPFVGSSALTGYFNGVAQTGSTISVGTGPNGTDQIVFASAPSSGIGVTVSADAGAINSAVVLKAIDSASREIDRYIGGRYTTPVTDPVTLTQLNEVAIKGVRWLLRQRRSMEEWSPIAEDRKAIVRWLELVAKGQVPLAASAVENTVTLSSDDPLAGSEDSVFDPPLSGPTLGLLYGP